MNARSHLRRRNRAIKRSRTPKPRPLGKDYADHPHSLVGHLIHLSGADPIECRLFMNSSGNAAKKRLGLVPAVKKRTRTTVTGRHVIVAVLDKKTGEKVQKSVRRRGNGRSRRRQGTSTVPVHRWTLDQFVQILDEMKPRKVEYKQIHADAFEGLIRHGMATAPVRRLPRHRRWSKRRNRK